MSGIVLRLKTKGTLHSNTLFSFRCWFLLIHLGLCCYMSNMSCINLLFEALKKSSFTLFLIMWQHVSELGRCLIRTFVSKVQPHVPSVQNQTPKLAKYNMACPQKWIFWLQFWTVKCNGVALSSVNVLGVCCCHSCHFLWWLKDLIT